MSSRTYIATLFAVLTNVTVFTAGALIVVSTPYAGDEFAAYLLPAATAVSLFLSPLAGWAIASWLVGAPRQAGAKPL